MTKATDIKPFDSCPALDGYHCQTSALAKIFHFHNSSLTEDVLLGKGWGWDASKNILKAGEMHTEIGLSFEGAEKIKDIDEKIQKASDTFLSIADLEEETFSGLSQIIK